MGDLEIKSKLWHIETSMYNAHNISQLLVSTSKMLHEYLHSNVVKPYQQELHHHYTNRKLV